MANVIRLTCKIEKSDHDGYCSGAECEYEEYEQTEKFEKPDDFEFFEPYEWSDEQLEKFIPDMCDTRGCSWYCESDSKSIENGIGKHYYKITPISVTVNYLCVT